MAKQFSFNDTENVLIDKTNPCFIELCQSFPTAFLFSPIFFVLSKNFQGFVHEDEKYFANKGLILAFAHHKWNFFLIKDENHQVELSDKDKRILQNAKQKNLFSQH
jgi:hypothetical protein